MWWKSLVCIFSFGDKIPIRTTKKKKHNGLTFPSTFTLHCPLKIDVAKYHVCQWWMWCGRLVPSDSDPQGRRREEVAQFPLTRCSEETLSGAWSELLDEERQKTFWAVLAFISKQCSQKNKTKQKPKCCGLRAVKTTLCVWIAAAVPSGFKTVVQRFDVRIKLLWGVKTTRATTYCLS